MNAWHCCAEKDLRVVPNPKHSSQYHKALIPMEIYKPSLHRLWSAIICLCQQGHTPREILSGKAPEPGGGSRWKFKGNKGIRPDTVSNVIHDRAEQPSRQVRHGCE
jgi:hypothetical protein